MKRTITGFTIVELLIVIVVIAILATISVVVYQGIQQRAKTVAYTSAVDYWDKFLQAEAAVAGTLPVTNYTCLGRASIDFPETDDFAAGVCFNQIVGSQTGTITHSSSFFDALQTEGNLMNGLLPTTNYTDPNGIGHESRGIFLRVIASPRVYLIQWVPQVTGQCGRGQSSPYAGAPGGLTGDLCTLGNYY